MHKYIMNKIASLKSIILVSAITLTFTLPGCKPAGEKEKKEALSARPTPGTTEHYQMKRIHPRKAKFSRKWEE